MKFIDVILTKDNEYTDDSVSYKDMLLRIESTNHCNFKCTFCPHPTMKRTKGFMDETLFMKIVDEASQLGFKKLDLRNFGEPILDKRLPRLASYAKSKGLDKIYIHTNGYGISDKIVNLWGESGIVDVNISLSPKREFSRTRPGTDVDKLFEDIEKVMTGSSQWKHIISIDYIHTGESTVDEEKNFLEWINKIGAQKRVDIQLHNWAIGEVKNHAQCHRLWSSVTVLFDGRVSLCCLDYEGKVTLGDMTTSTLQEVLNSPKYKLIRNNHINGKFLESCASCNMPTVKDAGPAPTLNKIEV
jgi:molybdenum cofactor biosynthesis enzyme MoaA